MFRRVFNIVYVSIAMLIHWVRNFFRKLKIIRNAPYKELKWKHKILKTVLITTKVAIFAGIVMLIFTAGLMFVVFFAAASAFGPGIANGMNEATGRNRYRRY